jgi:HK97 family phage major capsid protein
MRERIAALRKERAALHTEGMGAITAAQTENRALTDAEQTRDDEINARIDAIDAEIVRLGRYAEREEGMDAQRKRDIAEASASVGRPKGGRGAAGVEVGRDLGDADPKAGFTNLAEFALAVKAANPAGGSFRFDERLNRLNGANGGGGPMAAPTNYNRELGADEGYMVPPEFRQAIWEMYDGMSDIISRFTVEPTESNSVELIVDESTPWGATGVQAAWRSEGGQMTPSRLQTGLRQVRLNELYAFVLATDELLADAPRLNERLTRGAAEAINWKVSDSIMSGVGAGQPLGWMNSPALISVTRSGANLIAVADVLNVFKRILPLNLSKAFWIANMDTISQLYAMTSGQNNVWFPPQGGFAGAPGGFLMGLPVVLSEHASSLGTKGDLQLVDPTGMYLTQKSGGMGFASSIHLYFDFGVQAFRWTLRFGGEPFLSAAVTPAKGSNTKSHFVTLAT